MAWLVGGGEVKRRKLIIGSKALLLSSVTNYDQRPVHLSFHVLRRTLPLLWWSCRVRYLRCHQLRLAWCTTSELISSNDTPHSESFFCFELGSKWEAHTDNGRPIWLGFGLRFSWLGTQCSTTELSPTPYEKDDENIWLFLFLLCMYNTSAQIVFGYMHQVQYACMPWLYVKRLLFQYLNICDWTKIFKSLMAAGKMIHGVAYS